jgi:hypothetical protein
MDINCTAQFAKPTEAKITVGELFQVRCVLPQPTEVNVANLKVKVAVAGEANNAGAAASGNPGGIGTEAAIPGGNSAVPNNPAAITAPGADSKPVANQKYDVVVVKAAQAGEELGVAVTSYIVGPKDIQSLVLTDGKQDFTIKTPLQFEVTSILKPEEKPEMFGPISGVGVAIPMIYFILVGLALTLLVGSLLTVVRKHFKRKKLLLKLAALEDGTLAIQQYFAKYRKMQRENAIFSARTHDDADVPVQSPEELLKIVKDIEQAFKIFLARTFRITSFDQGWKPMVKELAKYHESLFSIMGNELNELTHEFQNAGKPGVKLQAKDVILISEKTRKWVEKSDQLHRAILSKDTQLIKRLRGAK